MKTLIKYDLSFISEEKLIRQGMQRTKGGKRIEFDFTKIKFSGKIRKYSQWLTLKGKLRTYKKFVWDLAEDGKKVDKLLFKYCFFFSGDIGGNVLWI